MRYNDLRIVILLRKSFCMKYGYRLELEDNSYKGNENFQLAE
jgi:hypothetical protein